MTRTAVVLVAAGAGRRLGRGTAKGMVTLAGRPMFVHAASVFARCASVTDLVVVVAPANVDDAAAALQVAGLPDATVWAGGETRAASVAAGVAACPAGVDVVAVHDAARPLVTVDLVERTLRALTAPWEAVAPGLPVVDTLKEVDGEAVRRTVDRDDLWAVQTPQVFPRQVITAAHRRGDALGATDDLALVEAAGGRVRLIEGDRRNFKVTYPEDLVIAEALLARTRG